MATVKVLSLSGRFRVMTAMPSWFSKRMVESLMGSGKFRG